MIRHVRPRNNLQSRDVPAIERPAARGNRTLAKLASKSFHRRRLEDAVVGSVQEQYYKVQGRYRENAEARAQADSEPQIIVIEAQSRAAVPIARAIILEVCRRSTSSATIRKLQCCEYSGSKLRSVGNMYCQRRCTGLKYRHSKRPVMMPVMSREVSRT